MSESSLASYLLGIVLLLAGLFLLPRLFSRSRRRHLFARVPRYPIRWLDFGLLLLFVAGGQFLALSLAASWVAGPAEDPGGDGPGIAILGIAGQLGLFLGVLGFLKLTPGLPPFRVNHQHAANHSRALVTGCYFFLANFPVLLLTGGFTLLFFYLLEQAGIPVPREPQLVITAFAEADQAWVLITLVALAVLAAPVVEEILFRGIVYRFLKSRTHPLLAALASGLIFALLHQNALALIPLLGLSLMLCLCYEASGNLLSPIFFHALFNGYQILQLHLSPEIAAGG